MDLPRLTLHSARSLDYLESLEAPAGAGCAGQSKICSPVEKTFQTTVPTRYSTTATFQTSSQEPFAKMRPVAAVPITPASTPAVLLMPSSTPEYLGPMSCAHAPSSLASPYHEHSNTRVQRELPAANNLSADVILALSKQRKLTSIQRPREAGDESSITGCGDLLRTWWLE